MSIILDNVSFKYKDSSRRNALTDVSLEIKKGEFVGIAGHTGSGKSTLIQHFNGLIKPTAGRVLYDGQDIYEKEFSLRELRGKVGLCFQYPEHQLFEVTVFDDICFGPKNLGLEEEEIKKRAEESMEMVGLDESYREKSPFELSGGQKRRVAVAGILAMEPEYFILDEPTAGLDPKGRDKVLKLLKKINQEKGITIILVTHSMEEIADYADRLIVMDEGKVKFDNTPAEVFKHKEELESIGLTVPFAADLTTDLMVNGFVPEGSPAITLEEAKAMILASYKKDR
ncbi:MAG: energy-coupling factor transporter ATPase [Lachnospiraceae bacterium]|nr:energy-coupling factor transporter ATPase [Lachnospiraceae bacterium]